MQHLPVAANAPSLSQQTDLPAADLELSANELTTIFKKCCKKKIAGEEEQNQLLEILQKINKKEFTEFDNQQMQSIIKSIIKVFPHLDNSDEIRLATALALSDLSDLGYQYGVNLTLKENTLIITTSKGDVDLDKINSCVQFLQKFQDYNIALEYASITPLSNDFLQIHGKLITKLDCTLQGNNINSETLELLIAHCPNIKSLRLQSTILTGLPELPESLKELTLTHCYALTSIPKLPSNLKKLNILNCKYLKSITELPANLVKFNLTVSEALTSLPKLSENLKELTLSSCYNLTSLPKLPENLTQLNLSSCGNLINLPKLPASLTELNLSACRALASLPELPVSLTQLDLTGCWGLTDLPELPPNLTQLMLSYCCGLRNIHELPINLIHLDLSGCPDLTSLPKLPEGLKVLDLKNCRKLKKLPELPRSLTVLYISCCDDLTSLPELPENLTTFTLAHCFALTNLPDLPAKLTQFIFSRCSTLDDNARLSAIAPRFAISIESGLSILPMLQINNKYAVGKLICRMSTCDSIIENIQKLHRELGRQGIIPIALKLLEEQPQKFFDFLEFMPIEVFPLNIIEAYPALKLMHKGKINNEKLSIPLTQKFTIGDHPEIKIAMLSDLLNNVNFSDESKPAYIAPNYLNNDGSKITVENVKQGMTQLIGNIESRIGYSGVPTGLEERDKWYQHLENLLKEIIFQVNPIIKRAESAEDLSKEDEFALHTAYREIITIAISGLYCGGRWLKDAIDSNMILQGIINKDEENVEQIFAKWLDSYKYGIPEQLTLEFTPMAGASMQPHIYNHVGKCLIEKRNCFFPEGTFDLNDSLVPLITPQVTLERIDKLLSPRALVTYFNNEINHLMQNEKRKVEAGEAENLKFSDFIQLIYGCAEPFCQSAIVEGESQMKTKALNYGIGIAEKRLKEAEANASNVHNKIEKWQRTLNAAEHGDTLALAKLIKLGHKANSEEQQLAAGKTKIEKRINRFKEKALTAQQSVTQYTTYLESQDKYPEQLTKLGYGRASSEWQSEKQNLLLEYIHKNQWGNIDYDNFEIKTNTLGTLNLMQTLGYLVVANSKK